MSARDEYIRKMHAKLNIWNAEIDSLAAKADQAGADVRAGYHRQLEALRAQRDEAKKKMERLQSESESAWQDMKAGVELAWDAMGEAIDSAKSRFK
jgi:uncharacterized protein involved in exopolysaccharide biosynthesis